QGVRPKGWPDRLADLPRFHRAGHRPEDVRNPFGDLSIAARGTLDDVGDADPFGFHGVTARTNSTFSDLMMLFRRLLMDAVTREARDVLFAEHDHVADIFLHVPIRWI